MHALWIVRKARKMNIGVLTKTPLGAIVCHAGESRGLISREDRRAQWKKEVCWDHVKASLLVAGLGNHM